MIHWQFLVFSSCLLLAGLQTVKLSDVKCLVCQQVVREITAAVAKVDPKKTIQVGSFRIQPDGSQKQTLIKYAGSEIHLIEVLETVCNAMDDFAQAKHKESGELALLDLSKDIEKLSTYDIVPDPELNKGLKYYCETLIEEYEDDIISAFKGVTGGGSLNAAKICEESAGYCQSFHSEL